mmetsp:Transcript_4869/g.13586  ORF Transcript_4869/g.13586 Transcript_4869/m.13586 type:complete len:343 (-) Transcript_4869:120-1148(-)
MIIRITPRDIPVSPAALRNQLTSRLASAPPLPATTVPTVPVDFTHTMDPSYSGGLRLTAPTEAQAAVAQVNVIDTGSERPSSEASSELDSGPGTEGGGLPRSSSDDEGSAPMTFDMSQAAAHVYLGDREDLDGSACEPLEDGQLVRLPLYVVPDMVLVPGATLPMRVSGPLRALVEAAMDALPPLKNLISVVCVHRDVECGALVVPSTGCIAVLRQMQAEGPTQYTNCLAVGLQRMRVNIDMELPWFVAGIHQTSVPVQVVGEIQLPCIPREVACGTTHWGLWTYRCFDAERLAAMATALVVLALPKVKMFRGSPLELSYWLTSNVPFDIPHRFAALIGVVF